MKTMVFCTCWLDDSRYIPSYVNWFVHHAEKFDQDAVFYLFDDGSGEHILQRLLKQFSVKSKLVFFGKDSLKENGEKVVIVSMRPHLGRPGLWAHKGWWRNFLMSYEAAVENNYEKIIHIESDFYVLSKKMADYMNGIVSGWHTGWCSKYAFRETAIQVICKDVFNVFGDFYRKHINNIDGLVGKTPEHVIAGLSSNFSVRFSGDRIGEVSNMKYPAVKASNFDYYGQLHRSFFLDAATEKRLAFFKMVDFICSFEKYNKSLLNNKFGLNYDYNKLDTAKKRYRLLNELCNKTKRGVVLDTLEIFDVLEKNKLKDWIIKTHLRA